MLMKAENFELWDFCGRKHTKTLPFFENSFIHSSDVVGKSSYISMTLNLIGIRFKPTMSEELRQVWSEIDDFWLELRDPCHMSLLIATAW